MISMEQEETTSTKTKSFLAAGGVFIVIIILAVVGSALLSEPQTQQPVQPEVPVQPQQHHVTEETHDPEPAPAPERNVIDFTQSPDNIQSGTVIGKQLLQCDETYQVQAYLDIQVLSQVFTVPVQTYLYYDVEVNDRVDLNVRDGADQAWTIYGIRAAE